MPSYTPPSQWDLPDRCISDTGAREWKFIDEWNPGFAVLGPQDPNIPPPLNNSTGGRDYAAEAFGNSPPPHDPVDELPFTFGKYRGVLPSKLIHKDPGYLVWVYENVDQNKWYMPDELIEEAKQRAAALPKR